MTKIYSSVEAQKATRYFDSLCKHFARKVEVERSDNRGRVKFPMGDCLISLNDPVISFCCEADSSAALSAMQHIIDSHVTRFGELKDIEMTWTSQSPE